MTLPSATVGCPPFNQPGESVLHLYVGEQTVTILVPAAPWKRYQPLSSSSHKELVRVVGVLLVTAGQT